jgi:hypothetical protein
MYTNKSFINNARHIFIYFLPVTTRTPHVFNLGKPFAVYCVVTHQKLSMIVTPS